MDSTDQWRSPISPELEQGDEAQQAGDLVAAEAAFRSGLANGDPGRRGVFRTRLASLLGSQGRLETIAALHSSPQWQESAEKVSAVAAHELLSRLWLELQLAELEDKFADSSAP